MFFFPLYLKRLYKSPEEYPDGVALTQQFDQPSGSKQAQETNVDEVFLRTNKFFNENQVKQNVATLNIAYRARAIVQCTGRFNAYRCILYKYYNYSYCNVLWDWLSLSKTEQTQGES
jgi:hypothetical protein